MKVAIIMGSTSDLSKVEPAVKILKDYGNEFSLFLRNIAEDSRWKVGVG